MFSLVVILLCGMRDKRTICRGNIQTGEEIFPLSEAAASELEEMILERERSTENSASPRDATRMLSLGRHQELSNTGDGVVSNAKGNSYAHSRHHSQSKDVELN